MLDQTAGRQAKGPRVWEFLLELGCVLGFVLSCLGSPARGQRCIVRRIDRLAKERLTVTLALFRVLVSDGTTIRIWIPVSRTKSAHVISQKGQM